MKKKKIIIAVCAALAVVLLALGAWTATQVWGRAWTGDEDVVVYVDDHATEASIVEELRSRGLARPWGWRLLSRVTPFVVRTGHYVLPKDLRMVDVYRRLQRGWQDPVHFTLPSVRTMDRLAGAVGRALMLDSATVVRALQDTAFVARYGWDAVSLPALFVPNTYEVWWDVSLDDWMQRMGKEHDTFWQQEGRSKRAADLGLTPTEVATLASIVDEETAADAEKPTIAGLYLNRLRRGMPLQADPTVKFALADAGRRRILTRDLTTESPYNTYLHAGLPPGPIRIATVAGIDAVLHAEEHTYLYMCAKEDFSGTHNFASSYSQHLANARRYARALNERGIKR